MHCVVFLWWPPTLRTTWVGGEGEIPPSDLGRRGDRGTEGSAVICSRRGQRTRAGRDAGPIIGGRISMFAIDQPSARSGSIQFESRQGPNTMQTRVDGYQAKYVLRFLQAPADFNSRLVAIALGRCPPPPHPRCTSSTHGLHRGSTTAHDFSPTTSRK